MTSMLTAAPPLLAHPRARAHARRPATCRPAADGIAWPDSSEQQAVLLATEARRMVADLRLIADAYLATITSLRDSVGQSPTGAEAGSAAGAAAAVSAAESDASAAEAGAENDPSKQVWVQRSAGPRS